MRQRDPLANDAALLSYGLQRLPSWEIGQMMICRFKICGYRNSIVRGALLSRERTGEIVPNPALSCSAEAAYKKEKWHVSFDRRTTMKKTTLIAAVLLASSSAFAAEFYVVQNPTTKRCTIVEQRPAPGVGVVIGDRFFGVRAEAESHMKATKVCEEAGGPGVTIEERDRVRPR
jgi:hypothetical protein